jgi:5-formaminoimidazole-4-carboxamide-1-(beta)-D-ribofuranosyl 5'-monophosphate synthetase
MDAEKLLRGYGEDVTIATLGSHSALETAYGAKQEGFATAVVCEKGRAATYAKYYKNLFDDVILIDAFADVLSHRVQERLRSLNALFVPNRALSAYAGYEGIEKRFAVPLLGSRMLLRTEERSAPRNQRYLLEKARIRVPRIFKRPADIDRLAIVKVQEKRRKLERAFFYAASPEEYENRAEELYRKGVVSKEALSSATIEEFVLGALFSANFFYGPLDGSLELLGFDRRIQTNLDGLLHLPAAAQPAVIPQNIEIGHEGVTLRESQLEKIFGAGERFVAACRREYPPGIIGPFALQGAIDRALEFCVFDVSPRMPGCPCVEPTSPYMRYRYFEDVGPGRRLAMEVKKALGQGRLAEIIT